MAGLSARGEGAVTGCLLPLFLVSRRGVYLFIARRLPVNIPLRTEQKPRLKICRTLPSNSSSIHGAFIP